MNVNLVVNTGGDTFFVDIPENATINGYTYPETKYPDFLMFVQDMVEDKQAYLKISYDEFQISVNKTHIAYLSINQAASKRKIEV